MHKLPKRLLNILLPILLGGFILYWVYRDFDFAQAKTVLLQDMQWSWMILSLFFGATSHVLRGWRWKQTLLPLGVRPRTSNCVDAIFLAYAANMVLPRVGEVSRCGVLSRYDKVPFTQSLGTVVTERLVDALSLLLITGVTLVAQLPVFATFFRETGTKIPSLLHLLTTPWFYVSLFSVAAVVILAAILLRSISEKVKGAAQSMWKGIRSLRDVKSMPLFLLYTFLMWACYFCHFYLAFYCFPFTAQLGFEAGLVMFVAGAFAVIVPTPNGAGSWHFAVITMMMLYGVSDTDASTFALLVHGIQTLLVILLGIWGWLHMLAVNKVVA